MYCRCTKKIYLNCPGEYNNEKALEKLLEAFVTANADKIKVSGKLRTKIERHYVIAEPLADYYKAAMKLDKLLIEYARYVTKESFEEKAGLTKNLFLISLPWPKLGLFERKSVWFLRHNRSYVEKSRRFCSRKEQFWGWNGDYGQVLKA